MLTMLYDVILLESSIVTMWLCDSDIMLNSNPCKKNKINEIETKENEKWNKES